MVARHSVSYYHFYYKFKLLMDSKLQVSILFMIYHNIPSLSIHLPLHSPPLLSLTPPPPQRCQCSVEWSVRPVMLHSPVSMGAGYCIIVPFPRTVAFYLLSYAYCAFCINRFRCFDICRRLTPASRTSQIKKLSLRKCCNANFAGKFRLSERINDADCVQVCLSHHLKL
jgi:hypothetical protein